MMEPTTNPTREELEEAAGREISAEEWALVRLESSRQDELRTIREERVRAAAFRAAWRELVEHGWSAQDVEQVRLRRFELVRHPPLVDVFLEVVEHDSAAD